MVRKPQPKNAAKALQTLFAKWNIRIGHGQALEAVAVVEGYPDWNTMSALANKPPEAQPLAAAPVPPLVSDSSGPFSVLIDGGYYNESPHFEAACALAEGLLNADDTGVDAEVRDARGQLVALFTDIGSEHRIIVTRPGEDPETVFFGHPDNQADFVESEVTQAVADAADLSLAWLDLEVVLTAAGDATGPVRNLTEAPLEVVRVEKGEITLLHPNLPDPALYYRLSQLQATAQ